MKNLNHILTTLSIVVSLVIMQDKPTNLQVLDFESVRDLKKDMKTIQKDLGVKCKFCHDINNKSIDTPHKNIAREMMRMQMDLNKSFFAQLKDSLHIHGEIPQISCWTCHHGSTEPEQVRPKPK